MIYTRHLQPKYFEKVKDGSKVIECRLFDEKRRLLKIGDTLDFVNRDNEGESIKTEITELLNYPTFNALVADFPASFFGGNNKTEILEDLYKFYTPEQEEKYSVLGIRFK